MYQSYGQHITLDGEFGYDHLHTREDLLEIRVERFFNQCQVLKKFLYYCQF